MKSETCDSEQKMGKCIKWLSKGKLCKMPQRQKVKPIMMQNDRKIFKMIRQKENDSKWCKCKSEINWPKAKWWKNIQNDLNRRRMT